MRTCVLLSAVLLLAAGAAGAEQHGPAVEPGPAQADNELAERLRNRIEAGDAVGEIVACGELVYCSCALPAFYERRSFRPAWVDASGPLPQAGDLERTVSQADLEGLTPEAYHPKAIRAVMEALKEQRGSGGAPDPGALTDLELLLTDAFLVYGSHLLSGRVDPESIDTEWHAQRREMDMPAVLEDAIESSGVEAALKALLPPQQGYAALKGALQKYRAIQKRGGWPRVGGSTKLERGHRGDEIAALRERLIASGDLESRSEGDLASGKPTPSDGAEASHTEASSGAPDPSASGKEGMGPGSERNADLFDEDMERAVIRFQRRHGLEADGVVGPATRAALNVPVEDRIEQIGMNMERYRWLPQDLGRRHIIVNIANFELDVIEDERVVETMRVVVGRQYRRTPVFSDVMTYLVLNPYWEVPPTIAKKDVLPSVRADINYLSGKKIRVLDGWGADAVEIDPKAVDWSRVDPGNLRYRFRQDPGPGNSLGRIKFMFPNKYHVYLHDTPVKDLFAKPDRAFSSGCIRVEKPIDLADYVMRGAPGWTHDALLAAISESKERTVRLPESIPVHLLYWTAFVNEDGAVHFRKDVYERDKPLLVALHELPPGPGETHDQSQTQMN